MARAVEGDEGGVNGADVPPEPHSSPREQDEGARGGNGSPRCFASLPPVPGGGGRRGGRGEFLAILRVLIYVVGERVRIVALVALASLVLPR